MKVDSKKLDRAFNPRCVAVVGDSARNHFSWIRAQGEFKGKLYSVQVNQESIEQIEEMGITNYTSLLDIPEPVDLAIVAVPRTVAPKILDECIRKEVAAAHFFTAGFAETGTAEGIELGRQLEDMAKKANFHLIGPNGMGIFNPEAGLKQTVEQYSGVSGPIGFIAQSGTHAVMFSLEAHLQGMRIGKSVSFGNGVVMEAADFLEYFGDDAGIKAIGIYIEGVRDGRHFLQVLKKVAERKPVVIWKGGRTEEGARAIASHTGSLAVPQSIWKSAIKQCGALEVDDMDELLDTIKALLYLAPVTSRRVAIAGGSGGQSVAITDLFSEAGLEVPLLSQKSYDEFATFFDVVGGSFRNPVDTVGGNLNQKEIHHILEILLNDPNVDNLVLITTTRFITMGFSSKEHVEKSIQTLTELKKTTEKPLLAVVTYSTPNGWRRARDITRQYQKGGIPAFPTMKRAAVALRNAFEYHRARAGAVAGV